MRPFKFIFSRIFLCVLVIAALVAAITFLCVYIHSLLPAAAAIALAYSLSAVTALCLLAGGSPSEFKISWLVLIVSLPVAGAVLYFISYLSRSNKRCEERAYKTTGCDGYEYFDDGTAYLNRLITLVSAAKREVFLEYYIISNGHIWQSLYLELLRARLRGVAVKIIYDGLGSIFRAPMKDFKRLKYAGVEIKVFNKLFPLPISRLNFRDHRKIAVIDGDAVFLGGVNIADEYANLTAPHGYWKDGGGVFFGQIAMEYREVFLRAFGEETGVREPYERRGKMRVLPVTDDPACRGSFCEDLLAGALYSARERILIFTPYLCMGEKLHDALQFAAARGVSVKIIIPGIPDKKLTYAITKTYCDRLCEEGVEVFVYTPGFMHFKCAVCDDGALIGSYNFDYRSMRLNYECGVWGGDNLASDVARDFDSCLAVCEKYRPSKQTLRKKITRVIAYLFAPLV